MAGVGAAATVGLEWSVLDMMTAVMRVCMVMVPEEVRAHVVDCVPGDIISDRRVVQRDITSHVAARVESRGSRAT